MIITIAGLSGSGKSTVAGLVAEKLGYRLYSIGEIRRRMALERGMTLDELNRLGEKHDFTDREVDEYQQRLGKEEDNIVIEGRTGAFFVPHSFKAFLKAGIRERAERIFNDEKKRDAEQHMDKKAADP